MINLSNPVRRERVRDFQPPWRTVFIYICPDCKGEVRVRACSFAGGVPVPGVGAIICPHCEAMGMSKLDEKVQEYRRRILAGEVLAPDGRSWTKEEIEKIRRAYTEEGGHELEEPTRQPN